MFRFFRFNVNNEYIHHSLRLFGITCWAMYYCAGFGWFRTFGIGLCFKNLRNHSMLFSERYGYTKHKIIGNWLIRHLPY